MYLRFFERQGWTVVVINIDETPDGIKKSLFKVSGKGVGKILEEKGNHRFTRISPFSKTKKLHTSFVGVSAEKVVKQGTVDIKEKDVDLSFFRGSGAGGQHRNKVETGVRLVHKPTGVIVEAVSERSQHQNREIAWERLNTKIANLERERAKTEGQQGWQNKGSIGFGERRRTYKLDAGFIKDEITGSEIRQVDKVLDGDLSLIGLSE